MTEREERGAEGSEIARQSSCQGQHLVDSLKSNPDSLGPFSTLKYTYIDHYFH